MKNFHRFFVLRSLALLALLVHCPIVTFADDESKLEEITSAAETRFEKTRDELDEKMTSAFDAAEKRVSAGGELKLSAEDRVKMLEVLQMERRNFVASRELPTSIYVRRASIDYLNGYNVAVGKLSREFARAIAFAEKKVPAELKSTIEKRDRMTAPFVCMTWKYTWAPKETNEYLLKSDGTFGKVGFKWTLEGDRIIMQGRDLTNLKASIWTDTCLISVDGRKIEGKNHLGHQKYGTRIE